VDVDAGMCWSFCWIAVAGGMHLAHCAGSMRDGGNRETLWCSENFHAKIEMYLLVRNM